MQRVWQMAAATTKCNDSVGGSLELAPLKVISSQSPSITHWLLAMRLGVTHTSNRNRCLDALTNKWLYFVWYRFCIRLHWVLKFSSTVTSLCYIWLCSFHVFAFFILVLPPIRNIVIVKQCFVVKYNFPSSNFRKQLTEVLQNQSDCRI